MSCMRKWIAARQTILIFTWFLIDKILTGGGPPEHSLLDEQQEAHLSQMNTNSCNYDTDFDVESDTYNRKYLQFQKTTTGSGPTSTKTSGLYQQQEHMVTAWKKISL